MAARGGLGSLNVSLSLDAADFTDGLTKAQAQAQKFADQVKAIAVGTAFGDLIADTAKKAAEGLKEMVFGAIDAADHLNDLSKQTGIAVETLGGIGFAASQAGGNLESATAAAGKLNKSLAEAASGNKQAAEAFNVLGISVKDSLTGQTKDAGTALVELAGKFETYADGPEKAALALRIFGKAGADIIPLLDDGGASLQANIEFFKRYSGVTTQAAQDADQFNDTLGKIKLLSGALGTTLASTLLPSFQAIADEFLHIKESGDGFTSAAQGVKAVFDLLVVGAANVAFVFLGVGREIGAVAAQLNALAHGDLDGFTAIGDAVKEDGKRARAELDTFVDNYKNVGKKASAGVDPADFAVLDQVAKGKKSAPGLKAVGSSDGTSELKKALDAQVKVVEDFAKAQADAYQLANTYLAGVYQEGIISQDEFFDTQKRVREAALADQVSAFDKEIALQRAFASNPAAKQTDRIAAEGKVTLLVQQRAEAVTKASGVEILAAQNSAHAVEALAVSYANLQASILAASGNDVGAQAIKNAQELKAAAILIQQAQGDPAVLGQLERVQELQAQRTQQEKDYGKLLDDSARREAEIYLDAEAGGKSEIETLAAIHEARAAAIVQLQAQAAAAAQLAAISGTDADAKKANDLSLAVKKAASEIDPLAKSINDSLESSFGSAFSEFITGSKSAKDAFKDFANSVISNIADIASKQLAKQVFGDLGGSSGAGGFLSGLFSKFGGSSSGGATTQGGGTQGIDFSGTGFPLASGTSYVPYDGFQATLHKGEAVVPAKYNDTNSRAPQVQITNVGGARVTPSTNSDGSLHLLVEAAADAAHNAVAADFRSGTGRASKAAQARFSLGAGSLPKRN